MFLFSNQGKWNKQTKNKKEGGKIQHKNTHSFTVTTFFQLIHKISRVIAALSLLGIFIAVLFSVWGNLAAYCISVSDSLIFTENSICIKILGCLDVTLHILGPHVLHENFAFKLFTRGEESNAIEIGQIWILQKAVEFCSWFLLWKPFIGQPMPLVWFGLDLICSSIL